MSAVKWPLRVAFIHPDLGIGGAERLVVDAALGLQKLGHSVDLYTSHHDPTHCFEETRDGTLSVHYIKPPFPRSLKGKLHIVFAHLRQLHLVTHLLGSGAPEYDVYFVDQLSTCIPFLRSLRGARVVFYCHFPDKLLANGAFVDGALMKKGGLLKRLYRMPMDWLEEVTTRRADVILANSKFTARVFKAYFPSIHHTPKIVYPGINLAVYDAEINSEDADVKAISSTRLTLLSLNRFEGKKNVLLAVQAFATLKQRPHTPKSLRLVLGGGYDPRLKDNVESLALLISESKKLGLTFTLTSPAPLPLCAASHAPKTPVPSPDVTFLLNFTTAQRTSLLRDPLTLALLYTPTNEHFGIVPIEAMSCGLPVLACNSGGPTESILVEPKEERTGWLVEPNVDRWIEALEEIVVLEESERKAMAGKARKRARGLFGMEAMARGIEVALKEAHDMGKVQESWIGLVHPGVWIILLIAVVLGMLW